METENLLTIIMLRGTAHVIAVDASSVHVCMTDGSMLSPLSLPRKKSQEWESDRSYAQKKLK